MDSNEIRACIDEARQLSEGVEGTLAHNPAGRRELGRVLAAMSRLAAAAEHLLAERESFAGRLRRSALPRPPQPSSTNHLSDTMPNPQDDLNASTPSPAPDA